ncbi:PREDICTED: serine protease nudel [Rhagoletis zephyria]|uniref:serine protease nudel n=1 Tax=Rhagoletis zephyria TaxID=28612 RepID=UPI000811A828|nr:PREDICTED: serine protease nudel [Rhagoletis zephyria]
MLYKKVIIKNNDIFGTRSQRKSLKTALTRILAISGIMLVLLMLIIVYHAIVFDRMDKLRQIEALNIQHRKHQSHPTLTHSGPNSPNIEIITATGQESSADALPVSQYDQSLDVQHLRSRIFRHRHGRRALSSMLDSVFLEREPDFDSLYAKVRNKRTRMELGKLEKEYFRCKKESINSNGCMVAFMKLYNLAKEISDKMDKMKKIFNENDEVLQRSHSSTSHESKDSTDKKFSTKDEDVHSGEKLEDFISSTTETSFTLVAGEEDSKEKNSSTTADDKRIHYSWIIDGHDEHFQANNPEKQNMATTPRIGSLTTTPVTEMLPTTRAPTTEAVTEKLTHGTESAPTATTDRPAKISWILDGHQSGEVAPIEIEKKHNDTTFTHTENESHKISWILDGFESDNETIIPLDRPVMSETTVKPHETNATTPTNEFTSIRPQTPKPMTVDEKPEKISWIIDGHHEEEEDVAVANTTKSSSTPEDTTAVTERITWILDGDDNEETTTPKLTTKPASQAEDKPDRFSWIIDGNDDNATATTTITTATMTVKTTDTPSPSPSPPPSSTRDIFEELEEITEGVEMQEDKLRKLKNDALSEEENEAKSTIAPHKHYTSFSVTLTNTSDVIITYGGDCATTPKTTSTTPQQQQDHEKTRTGDKDSAHPLDYASSVENMLESAEGQHGFKPIKHDDAGLDNKNLSLTTTSPYDPKQWEELFRKGLVVQQQEDELIDTFDAADLKAMMKYGAKLNTANVNSFKDAQFLLLCEQVAKRLRNKGANKDATAFTPAPGAQFTSRAPGVFPVTGETMKATAQFLYNPNFGMPTIPICFYITPANFRLANQSPMWTPAFQGMPGGGFSSGPMGFNTPNGVFFVPQNFGPTGNFFGQTGGTGSGGSQSNIPNVFTKNAAPRKQQQQFFCTYMQNNANNNSGGSSGGGLGSGSSSINGMGFSNANFKMRTSAQNLSTDIIYASYTNVPDHLGHMDHFKCDSPEQTGCYGGKECIQKSAWCDNFVDCSDGSDEAACRCIDRLASNRICDGYADCPMGEDELGCFGCNDLIYSCYGSPEEYAAFNRSTLSMCYSATEKCDGIMNCLNGRDELDCNIIVKDVKDHMSHAVSSSSGFLFHNYRGEWYPVCNNAQKWAQDACANEADRSGSPNVTFSSVTLPGPFIEPTLVGQAHFPQSCQQRDSDDNLLDQAAYVTCSPTECGKLKKKVKTPFRRKRSRALLPEMQKVKEEEQPEVSNGRIVGGSYSKAMQWPFVVAIYRDGKFHCGGTIYSENWIISAAHCVINYHKYYYEIHAGLLRRSSFSSSTQIRAISHIIVHQAYERRSMRNDLSLLKMSAALTFNRWVKPICLPDIGRTTAGDDWIRGPKENTLCTVVGWGAVREKGPGSDQLREVVVPIRKQCNELDDRQSENVCAGDVSGGRDACQGDSGGPLFCRSVNNTDEWYLAGVVSHGNGCARPGEFGAYTRVALYLDWIELAMKFPAKLQPRLICPGYVCVWGGERCISKKRRCDRVVDCLGGEDEVGCTYNFIPDMVGSVHNISTTTESDYYPESVVTSPPCKAGNSATQARAEVESVENTMTPGTTGIQTNASESNGSSTTQRVTADSSANTATTAEAGTKRKSTTEMSTAQSKLSETTTAVSQMEASTMVPTSIDTTTEEPVTTETSTEEPSTTDITTTEVTASETMSSAFTSTEASTTTTVESTKISTVDQSNTSTVGTSPTNTTGITTTETSTMDTTTDISSTTDLTTVSLKSFDVENLVTTTPNDSKLSSTLRSETTSLVTTEGITAAATTTVKPRKLSNSTIPGKFICQRIPQIVEVKNRCDRVLDCEDGSDEDDCSCRDYLKGSLNILICDGKADCEDLTDEENCGNCSADEYLCPLSKICLPLEKRCDAIIDCDFREDEKDCFTLTNGREIVLDTDRRPVLKSAGIFSRNSHGKWRVVCSHEIPHSEQIATTAANVCAQLGFRSLKFYNTTQFMPHDTIVPIHPDIRKKMRLQSHFSSIYDDNHHLSSVERQFRADDFVFKARTQYIERVMDECLGLYVECEAKANGVEPIRTISAGELVSSDGVHSTGLQPALETHGKPNVFVTPPSPVLLVKKKDEVLDKLDGVIESRKNMTLLIDNKLHEAVEELHWPWIVDVYVDGRLWCVGALVDKHWVMVHETCHYGVRFNTNYIAVLLGGGKTKRRRHKSTHEQIRRVDCFELVPKSDVLLYHLEKPAHFTHYVLPTFLPDSFKPTTDESSQCIAILHDDHSGRIKAVAAIEERNDSLCKVSDMSCYRLVERKPPQQVLNELSVSEEDVASLSEEVVLKEAFLDGNDTLGSTISRFTTCTQFGRKNFSRTALDPIDQGILACRQSDTGWYPMALFDYNNTNCYSFKDSIALRTLEKVHGTIQALIDQPKCEHSNAAPVCSTFRCTLGDCLEEEQICNGFSDCHDDADEEKQMCIGRKKVCQPSEMKCRTTYKCIPKTKFCDHIADCDDMTDEPTLCSCYTYLQATNPKKICDGIRNCWDKSDESPALCNCTADHFQCGGSSKECVPRDFVCDKEPDCPNGEDEKYCFGLEFPQQIVTRKTAFTQSPQIKHKQLPQYGQVIEQTYGVWHTKCFARDNPPDVKEVRQICQKLGFSPFKQPSYRIIDDAAQEVVETNEWPDQRGRSFGNDYESPLNVRYRSATKAVVVSKFSPLNLNDELTLFLKPSRPIAEVTRWNAADSDKCYRLEVKCM